MFMLSADFVAKWSAEICSVALASQYSAQLYSSFVLKEYEVVLFEPGVSVGLLSNDPMVLCA